MKFLNSCFVLSIKSEMVPDVASFPAVSHFLYIWCCTSLALVFGRVAYFLFSFPG